MSVRHKVGSAVLLTLCWQGRIASAHELKTIHDAADTDRYADVLHELSSANTGADLGDARLTDLTHSIQGVFDDQAPRAPIDQHAVKVGTKALADIIMFGSQGVSTSNSKQKKQKANQGQATQKNLEHANHTERTAGHTDSSLLPPSSKAIEETVGSLPMASFALSEPQPSKNKTHPFPGNATQKAAWDDKETKLEKEVAELKARLADANTSLNHHLAATGHGGKPAATGQSLHKTNDKPLKEFMSKSASQKQPEHQEVELKAKMKAKMRTTIEDVVQKLLPAEGVGSKVAKDGLTSDEESILEAAEERFSEPPKKAQSTIQLQATVVEASVNTDDDKISEQSPSHFSLSSWFSSLFSWFQKPSPPAKIENTVVPKVELPRKTWFKQDSERTARAAHEEHEHEVILTDVWGQMEKEDVAKEDSVRSEDASERRRAETAELPHTPTKAELQGRHGPQMSGFFSQLEKEDNSIAETVESDDIVKYAELTQAQDSKVSKESDLLRDLGANNMERNPLRQHSSDKRVAIHEPWLRRELKDKALEEKVHDDPDLQMLQLLHRHHRK